MSTNGQITFIGGGHAKHSYSHWDGQPSGLGLDVLGWLRGALADEGEAEIRERIEALTPVGDFGAFPPPTAEQEQALAKFADPVVGGPDEHWYKLLRRTQGDPALILKAGYTYDQLLGTDWEDEYYTYVVDADKRTFSFRGEETCTWSWDKLPDDSTFTAATGA